MLSECVDQDKIDCLNEDIICLNVYSSKDNQSLHKSLNGEFIFYQILLQRLLDDNQQISNEIIQISNSFQPENAIDERLMKEFDKEYKSCRSIHWLTRESCIHKLLTKALRTQNIDKIFLFSKFLKDLYKQLKDEYQIFIRQEKSSILVLYSARFINKEQLQRLKFNQGQLISMNSFLSTTRNKEKSIEFIRNHSPPNEEFISILFEIFVNIQNAHRPLADIKHLSAFAEEEQILFMFGSIFRIDQIDYDQQIQVSIIKLTLCGENDSDMKHFFSTLNSKLNGKNKEIYLGFYLFEMQKYQQAQDYYMKLLENKRFHHPDDLAYLHYGLSQINQVKSEYQSAIMNLNKATDYLLEYTTKIDQTLLSQCYNDLGKVYFEENNFMLAFYYYNKALKTSTNDQRITYHGLAQIHLKLENYFLSLEYLEKVLEKQSLTEYSSIANTFIQMSKLYGKLNLIDKSTEMFNKALESQLKIFNNEHPDISYTYIAQSIIYSNLNDQDKALDWMGKAYQLQLKTLPNSHQDLNSTLKYFGEIYMKKDDLDNSLAYYHKYLENQLKTFSWKDSIIGETYFIIANIYWKKKDYDQALIYFYLLFQNQIERFRFGNPFLSNTYLNIAQIYFEKKDFQHAKDYYQKLLQNELVYKLYEDFSLCHIYEMLAKISYKNRILNQSLLYYNRLLNCHLNKQPFNQTIIEDIFKNIGKVYLKKKDFNQSLLIYKQLTFQSLDNKSSFEIFKDINNIHFEKRHLHQSAIYFEEYLDQQIKQFKLDNPTIGRTYRILANIYYEQNKYDKALNYFLKLLNNQLTRKYFHHSSLKNLYQIIANIYYKQRKFDKAMDYFYRLIDCLLEKRPLDDVSVLNSFTMIGKIFLKKHYSNQTLNYLNKSFENSNELNPIDNQFSKSHLDESLFYFSKFLSSRPRNVSSYIFNIDSLYTIIGNIYLEKGDPYQSLHYFHLLINYQFKKEPLGNLSIATTYSILGDICVKLHNFKRAIQYYQSSLAIYQRIYPPNHFYIRIVKHKIRDAFFPFI